MRMKKTYGKVYGATFTANERRAMDMEIKRQLLEWDAKYTSDMDAMVLYTLMAHYGWKKKRLRKFWEAFQSEHKALRDYYQMDAPGDNEWLAKRKLKDIGVDVEEWNKEVSV